MASEDAGGLVLGFFCGGVDLAAGVAGGARGVPFVPGYALGFESGAGGPEAGANVAAPGAVSGCGSAETSAGGGDAGAGTVGASALVRIGVVAGFCCMTRKIRSPRAPRIAAARAYTGQR